MKRLYSFAKEIEEKLKIRIDIRDINIFFIFYNFIIEL